MNLLRRIIRKLADLIDEPDDPNRPLQYLNHRQLRMVEKDAKAKGDEKLLQLIADEYDAKSEERIC